MRQLCSAAVLTLSILSAFFLCTTCYSQELQASAGNKPVKMSLANAVSIAMENSRTVKSAYLDRVAQRYDLKVAEDKFTPHPVLTMTGQKNVTKTGGSRTDEKTANVTGSVTEILPTGAELDLSASHVYDHLENSTEHSDLWNVSLSQPLLKGAGTGVATASVKTARINENIYVLSLKSTVMDTVTSVIIAYRNLLQATRQLEISRQSLKRAEELVSINKELIAAGRMAKVEIVQAEADVSNRKFDVLTAENNVDSARLALINLLDIDRHTMIVPTEKVNIEPRALNYEKCEAIAFRNRPDYLSLLLELRIAKLNLMLAKNNKLWDLSVFGGYGSNDVSAPNPDTRNWTAGVTLTIPLRDLTLEQGYISARTDLDKTELSIAKLRETIGIEVKDALRDVEIKLKQVTLARESRKLARQQLDIEREKMKAGRSTNFQLVTFQNDLVTAQNNELSAMITYLDALTSLDRTLGTTLDDWHITISEKS